LDKPDPSLFPFEPNRRVSPSGQPGSPQRRRFNATERIALYLDADGHCRNCGTPLAGGWHADHRIPYVAGGPTDMTNGQALCPSCNLTKGSTMADGLRVWQQRATEAFYANTKTDFLVSATPGAGKTHYAISIAQGLLGQGLVDRVVVVVPTDALRSQWAVAAGKSGLQLKPVSDKADYDKAGYVGCVVTYQQLLDNKGADAIRTVTRRSTLVILDEVHHAGDNRSWGESLRTAVENATYRLSLTGTPWRRDAASPIPFVEYNDEGTVVVDYAYEYGAAVADGVCRRIEFHAYDGEARWIDPSRGKREYRTGDSGVNVEFTAKLGGHMAEEDVSAALDVVYEPKYQWMPAMLQHADAMLEELRADVPDAAGLVVCERQWHAHGYAALIEQMTGTRPPVVVSDPKTDPAGEVAKSTIQQFREGTGRWIVAVKMISEGVDIPRLAVGVYASKTQTPLFFRQVVGRFVRTRPDEEFNARLLLPAVPELLRHSREIEEELRHQLELEAEKEEKARAEQDGDGQGEFDFRTALSASAPVFDRAILGGDECSPEELAEAEAKCRSLGIPTRFALNLVPLLRQQRAGGSPSVVVPDPVEEPRFRREKMLRQEVELLARRAAYKAGRTPKEINGDLLRFGHPARKKATVEQLEGIRRTLLEWLGDLA
jgi:superfamily II DNA or RNA helicase